MANALKPEEQLLLGESLVSEHGAYELTVQEDGNLVLYRRADRHPLWDSETYGRHATHAVMQADGNFVIKDSRGRPLWSTGTANHHGAWLKVFDVGVIGVYHIQPLWREGTEWNGPGAIGDPHTPQEGLLP